MLDKGVLSGGQQAVTMPSGLASDVRRDPVVARVETMLPAIKGHSTRVGVTQDNFAAGEDLPAIMQAYGWKDTRTVLRYGRKLAARSGAASRLAAKVWGESS